MNEYIDETDLDEPDTILTVDPNVLNVPIRSERSLLITEPSALDAVQQRKPLGKLLMSVGRAAITEWAPNEGQRANKRANQVNEWVATPFQGAAKEFAEHNALPFEKRIGMKNDGNPWQRLINLWPQLNNGDVGPGPFRLLAVVNRMDLTGDVDERGIIDAAKQPRTMGEARLIFGVVDRDHERNTGKPYPMVFIIEFRLPALDANYNVVDNFDFRGNLFRDDIWRQQMERWGLLWRSLSASDPGTAAYRTRLLQIVQRFAKAENFVALRADIDLRSEGKREFELREFYILKNNAWDLIPRKPRDEAYKCGDGPDLITLVNYYWDAAKGDLKMDRVTPQNPRDVIGWNLPRTMDKAPMALGNTLAGCPKDGARPIPFEMLGTDGDGGNRVTAPFGRVKPDELWRLPGAPEDRRHQFAIRTCTGCHSSEAGMFGFHVEPRLANRRSQLSTFLKGGAAFTHGGVTYRYDELAARASWMDRASRHDPSMQLFESLYRHDAR